MRLVIFIGDRIEIRTTLGYALLVVGSLGWVVTMLVKAWMELGS